MTQPTLTPQCQQLIRHFRVKKSITPVEAQNVYRIRALARRIMDLKAHGFKIEDEWRKDPTGQRYKRYTVTEFPTQ